MKKRILFILLLSIGLNHPAALSMQTIAKAGHEKFLEAQKAYKQTRERIKRNWFCLRNPKQCSPQEAASARKWFVAVPASVIIATLALVGITISTNQIIDLKNEYESSSHYYPTPLEYSTAKGKQPPAPEQNPLIQTAKDWTNELKYATGFIHTHTTIVSNTPFSTATPDTLIFQFFGNRRMRLSDLNYLATVVNQLKKDNSPQAQQARMALITATNEFYKKLITFLKENNNPYISQYKSPLWGIE